MILHKPEVRVALWVVSLVLVAAGGYWGSAVPFSKQWPLYEALRTTAAIVFAVVGAWIAIVFPERFKSSFRRTPMSDSDKEAGMGRFFTPVANSTVILCAILVLGVLAPILKLSPWLISNVEVMRGLSYAILVALTLWQLLTVLLTLDPADDIKTAADRADQVARRQRNRDVLTSEAHNPDA